MEKIKQDLLEVVVHVGLLQTQYIGGVDSDSLQRAHDCLTEAMFFVGGKEGGIRKGASLEEIKGMLDVLLARVVEKSVELSFPFELVQCRVCLIKAKGWLSLVD